MPAKNSRALMLQAIAPCKKLEVWPRKTNQEALNIVSELNEGTWLFNKLLG